MPYTAAPTRYDAMQYRPCGMSGLKLPVISLGLWQNFGGSRSIAEVESILTRAFDLGVTHFDLANNYGPPCGAAESNAGEVFSGALSPYRDELVISTKAGYDMWPGPCGNGGSRKYLLGSLDASLKRLQLDYVDIFYSHRFDPETPLEETMGALDAAVRQGKTRYAGISSYPSEQTKAAVEILTTLGTPLLIHQSPYSMLLRRIEGGLLDVLGRLGVGCIAFMPLAQGVLTERYLDGVPSGSRASQPGTLGAAQVGDDVLDKVRALSELAKRRNQTMAQMALAWTLRDNRVTSALIGVSSVTQLEDNVATIENLTFTSDELGEIEKILSS
jgi:L-glyceraldehyde 3-phosphate reductase